MSGKIKQTKNKVAYNATSEDPAAKQVKNPRGKNDSAPKTRSENFEAITGKDAVKAGFNPAKNLQTHVEAISGGAKVGKGTTATATSGVEPSLPSATKSATDAALSTRPDSPSYKAVVEGVKPPKTALAGEKTGEDKDDDPKRNGPDGQKQESSESDDDSSVSEISFTKHDHDASKNKKDKKGDGDDDSSSSSSSSSDSSSEDEGGDKDKDKDDDSSSSSSSNSSDSSDGKEEDGGDDKKSVTSDKSDKSSKSKKSSKSIKHKHNKKSKKAHKVKKSSKPKLKKSKPSKAEKHDIKHLQKLHRKAMHEMQMKLDLATAASISAPAASSGGDHPGAGFRVQLLDDLPVLQDINKHDIEKCSNRWISAGSHLSKQTRNNSIDKRVITILDQCLVSGDFPHNWRTLDTEDLKLELLKLATLLHGGTANDGASLTTIMTKPKLKWDVFTGPHKFLIAVQSAFELNVAKWGALSSAEKKQLLLNFVKFSIVPNMKSTDRHPQIQLAINLKNKIEQKQFNAFIRTGDPVPLDDPDQATNICDYIMGYCNAVKKILQNAVNTVLLVTHLITLRITVIINKTITREANLNLSLLVVTMMITLVVEE
jgi:hypothetical protein